MNLARIKNITAAIAVLALSACAITPAPTHKLVTRFDDVATERLLAKGSNTIKGSALMRQMGGGVVTCAGQEVRLYPATSYAQERITVLYGTPSGGYNPIQHAVKFENDAPVYHVLSLKRKYVLNATRARWLAAV